jgi:inosine/xanthosine triphosphatase
MRLTIAVGSTNPVKLAAVQAVLSKAFTDSRFVSLTAPSGVPEQPWGDEQTRLGAFNRARQAQAESGARYGVGLEGGLIETSAGLMTCAWCAMVDGGGKVGYGGGVHILLPPVVANLIKQHGELGPAMDALTQKQNTKQKQGAVGILTRGLLNRQAAYEQLVAMAAGPFVTDYYQ